MRSTTFYGWPVAEGSDARRDFPAVVDGPRSDAIDAELNTLATDLAGAVAALAKIGAYASAYGSGSGLAAGSHELDLSIASQRGGFTLSTGRLVAPHTGNYLVTIEGQMRTAQTQFWMGHTGLFARADVTNHDGQMQLAYSFVGRYTAGQLIPRPVIYGAPNAFDCDVYSHAAFLGDV